MRLLVDCHCFDYGESQGINTYIRELYKTLLPIAKDITFIFAAHNVENIKNIFGYADNIEYLRLRNRNKYYRLAIEYPRLIKQNSIDWAHFQYTIPIIKNCKTIVTLHDILFEDFPSEFPLSYRFSKHFLFKYSAKRSDILLTVSDYSKDRISAHYKIPSSNIFVTHNGVSEDYLNLNKQLASQKIEKKYGIKNYILYVSRFEPRKNQQGLIRAYKHLNLSEKGIELVFIGIKSLNCEEFDSELALCELNVRQHIHLLQNIPYKELKNWYAGAKLFVYPSKAEGFGIPPLEAGACRIPSICNNQTAMRDFKFFSPFHLNTGDQKCLEQAIRSILSVPPTDSILKKIQSTIYDEYSWLKIGEKFYQYLKNQINE